MIHNFLPTSWNDAGGMRISMRMSGYVIIYIYFFYLTHDVFQIVYQFRSWRKVSAKACVNQMSASRDPTFLYGLLLRRLYFRVYFSRTGF